MTSRTWPGPIAVFVGLCFAGLAVVAAQQTPPAAGQAGAQKPRPAPTGPLAAAKYRDVQIMKDVTAEQFDHSDYEDVAGVKMPFTIKRTSWNAVDTLTIADIKPNVQMDEGKSARPKR